MFLTDSHIDSLTNRFTKPKTVSMEKSFGGVLKTMETVGAGATMAYMNAKYSKPGRNAFELGGVPVDLVLGVLGNVAAISQWAGEHSEDLHNISNGLLCAYAVRLGTIWGADAKVTKMRVLQQQAGAPPFAQQRNLPAPAQTYSFPAATPNGVPQPAAQYDWAA